MWTLGTEPGSSEHVLLNAKHLYSPLILSLKHRESKDLIGPSWPQLASSTNRIKHPERLGYSLIIRVLA